MEKVFEQRLTKPLSAVCENIDSRVQMLNRKYGKLSRRFRVSYGWDAAKNTLLVSNSQYGITVAIRFTQTKITGSYHVPLLLKPLAWVYRARILTVVRAELDAFLKSI